MPENVRHTNQLTMSNLLRVITLSLLFPLLVTSLQAQQNDANKMSLQEAIDYAFAKSIEIKNAQINIADAEQQIFERRASGLPQLERTIS